MALQGRQEPVVRCPCSPAPPLRSLTLRPIAAPRCALAQPPAVPVCSSTLRSGVAACCGPPQPHAVFLHSHTLRPCAVACCAPVHSCAVPLHSGTLRPNAAPCCAPAQPYAVFPCAAPRCTPAQRRTAPLRSHTAQPVRSHAAPLRGPTLCACTSVRCAALLRSPMLRTSAAPCGALAQPHERSSAALELPPPPPQKRSTTTPMRSTPPNTKLLRPVTAPGGAGCAVTRRPLRPPWRDRVNRPMDGWGLRFSGSPPSALPSPRAGQPESRIQNPLKDPPIPPSQGPKKFGGGGSFCV